MVPNPTSNPTISRNPPAPATVRAVDGSTRRTNADPMALAPTATMLAPKTRFRPVCRTRSTRKNSNGSRRSRAIPFELQRIAGGP